MKLLRSVTSLFESVFGKGIAKLRNRQKTFQYELAVCAIFKNEGRFLQEWLTFHHGIGVNHFYLYNDASEDDFQSVLQPWIARGLVTIIEWPTQAQVPAYNHCVRTFRQQAKWIAFIDLDEFLFSPQGQDLPQVLQEYADLPAIFVYWVLFGSSGHTTRSHEPVVESYTRCMDFNAAINDNFDHGNEPGKPNYVSGWAVDGKSIVNPRLVRTYNIHKPKTLWLGETLDENRNIPRVKAEGGTPSYAKLRINHYWSKSIEDLTEKVERGSICNKRRPKRNLERWLTREKLLNVAEDTSILSTWKRAKATSTLTTKIHS